MQNLKIAVAQVSSIKGNVVENISTHIQAIKKASEQGVAYIVFPELSLTGYEPSVAKDLAFSDDDARLQPLIDAAIRYNITLAVGAPLLAEELPNIGLIIIFPSGTVERYAKIYLHAGEEQYFNEGRDHHYLSINDTIIANAICADTNNPKHANNCFEFGAEVYIAGVMITEPGYQPDSTTLRNYAKKYNILVAIANHHQTTGGYKAIGKSAIWTSTGLLAQAGETDNALVVATNVNNQWSAQVIKI